MEPIYNQLSEEYSKLYLKNILQFQNQSKKYTSDNNWFVDFYPSFGTRPDEYPEFLIYGQAPNGWGTGFNVNDQIEPDKISKSIEYSNSYYVKENHCPLDWVNVQWSDSTYNKHCKDESLRGYYPDNYRTSRSFFWNVVYKLICDFYSLDKNGWDWARKLVWSNLYKLAPGRSNPDIYERDLQQSVSGELVKMEIEEITPKYCIVLTGSDWWKPFRKILKPQIFQTENLPSHIESHEQYNQTEIIVTERPRVGNSDEFVKQILEVIKK